MLIRPPSPASRGDAPGVDHIELKSLSQDLLLDRAGERIPHAIGRMRRVEQQRRAGRRPLQDLGALQEAELVAADETGLRYQVRRADGLGTKTQVRGGLRSGLLGVINEIPLGVEALVAQNLDGVLVGTDSPVRAQAEEHGPYGLGRLDVQRRVEGQARVGDVVHNPDGEAFPGVLALQLGQYAGDHSRGEFL